LERSRQCDVAFLAAVIIVAEVGDFTRFDNTRQVMANLGLKPFARSSGTRYGAVAYITKAGNACAACLDRRGLALSNAGPRQGVELRC
jgi:transposase